MFSTFNMGIGFCLIVDPQTADRVQAATARHDPTSIGVVTSGGGVDLS
jgi:phosphoribosylaminoimidazole (AIR) synthetase